MPRHKCEQCLLVTKSLRFDTGIRGNTVQIGVCGGSEQIATATLGDEGEGQIQEFSLVMRADGFSGNDKKRPQISPLRYAPVEMTILWLNNDYFFMENPLQLRHKIVVSTGA